MRDIYDGTNIVSGGFCKWKPKVILEGITGIGKKMNKPFLVGIVFLFMFVVVSPREIKDSLIEYGRFIYPSYPGVGLLIILGLLAILIFYNEIKSFLGELKINQNF